MSDAFSSYPVLTNDLLSSIGYIAEKPIFGYTERFEEYSLSFDLTSENPFSYTGKINDPRCSWYPVTHDLKIAKTCRLTSAYCLFGEGGIAPYDATLGLALQWISTDSDERGIIPFATITRADSASSYDVEHTFPAGKLKGSLKLQTILYLKNAGIPKPSEQYFAQQSGTILGILDQIEAFLDGNGSIFPIVLINAPGKALWSVYYNDAADPLQDRFTSENVEIRLNKAHPSFDSLKIENSLIESPLFLEVLSSALMVIVESAKENLGEDWDNVLDGTDFEPGSIAEAICYFVRTLQWDVSNPARLSASIRDFFETKR